MKNMNAKSIMVCLSMIFVGLMLTGQSFAKVDLGKAVAIWAFDEGSGKVAKDSSVNGNDAIL
jgi:hypothetical protein